MTLGLEEAVDSLIRCGASHGATETEAVAVEANRLEVGVRLGKVEKLKRAREHRVALRAFVGQSSAVCSTADLTRGALEALVDECVAMARATASDPFAGLPSPACDFGDIETLELYDPSVERFEAEEAIRRCQAGEAAALAVDSCLTNSEGAECAAGSRELIFRTSKGTSGRYRTSSFSLSVVPVAHGSEGMQRDYWYSASRHLEDLEPSENVGRKAAARTLRRLGARPIQTARVPVVFDPETAASLLGNLASAASGTSVYRGTSFLLGRLDERVAPDFVTIVDDPLRPRSLGARPFDAEGFPSRRNVILERGRFATYLLDSYSARKLGLQSTASAVRALGEPPVAGTSTLYLEPGRTSPEEIIATVKKGLYVTELIGSGVNPVTGDYSRGAAGIWIEEGKPVHAVEEITIAGNLLEIFATIEMVGSDLEFRSSIACPTVKVAAMTVAGPA